jgi:hypothetical protein
MVVPHPCFKIREESRGIDLGGYANEAICSPAAGFFFPNPDSGVDKQSTVS